MLAGKNFFQINFEKGKKNYYRYNKNNLLKKI